MMSTAAFIIGMIILGLCLIVAALVLSGAINGAATALKESAPQSLQQPTLTFLTEYDAADYLGVSLNELDYIRSEGLLDGAFIAVTSLEQTGEESYVDYEDGIEVSRTRPVMSNVTRFLFNRQLLDEKMMDAIKNGSHINPFRSKTQDKKQNGKKNNKNFDNGGKKENKHPVVEMFADNEDKDTAEKASNAVQPEPETKPAPEEKTKPEVSKPAAAGPPKPMGPIGDEDESGDDVIDIMARINEAKKNNNGRPGNSSSGNGNRNNPNRNNGNRNGNPNRGNNNQNRNNH